MKARPTARPRTPAPPGITAPTDAQWKATLGNASAPLEKVVTWLEATHADFSILARHSEASGWHRIYVLKKRRLFYLVPRRGDFRFSLILGDRALALLAEGGFAGRLRQVLPGAKRYPEGTAFVFERKTFDPDLVIALLQAKLAR